MRLRHFHKRNKNYFHFPLSGTHNNWQAQQNGYYYPEAQPDWLDISIINEGEILILANDTGDGYMAMLCQTGNSGTYTVEVWGGSDGLTLINTQSVASNTQWNYQIPSGLGKYCSLGYYTYIIRVYATSATIQDYLTSFNVKKNPSGGASLKWLASNINASRLSTFSFYAGVASCDTLEYVNFKRCENITALNSSFNNCPLKRIDFPKVMDKLSSIAGLLLGGCKLKELILPSSMATLTGINYLVVFTSIDNATVENIRLPDFAPNLATFDHSGWSPSYTKVLKSLLGTMNTGTTQVFFKFHTTGDITQVEFPLMRCSLFVLSGKLGSVSKINHIEIDWANSQYSGSSPQIDIAYNSLSATEIDRIFTALPTVTGKTIRVTGNAGAATCTPSIATAKGWTVTQ